MSNIESSKRFTLAEAIALPKEDWDGGDRCPGIQVNELKLTDSERQHSATIWLWLCDVLDTSTTGARVGNEVLTDGALIVALNLPAVEFLHWFRAEQWDTFDSTERTGSEVWAWGVLRRACAACETLGKLALQQPLRPPSSWPGMPQ
jgi:hypothetical protein